MESPLTAAFAELFAELDHTPLRDQFRLRKRLHGAAKIKNQASLQAVAQSIAADIAIAKQKMINRQAACPSINYPENLPVSQKKRRYLQSDSG